MVKLTQIDENNVSQFAEKPAEQVYSESDSESDSEVEDDFDIENETLYDRIVALKDIIPPQQRTQIVNGADYVRDRATRALSSGGSLLWTLSASVFLLGVPLALSVLSETQLQEMQREMNLQESAQSVLAAGSEEEKR